jgi:ABC-type Fe3+ transport system substrate-binding protein
MRGILLLLSSLVFVGACTSQETKEAQSSLEGSDRLVIVSPHRKSIQEEFIPRFRDYYRAEFNRDVQVDWLDQGGTSAGLRFIRARYASNAETSGVDLFWGGGASAFIELDNAGFLEPFPLSEELAQQVPERIAGVALRNSEQTWHATAISGFGIFYNKKALSFQKLSPPRTWDDIAHPRFQGQISLTDPRQSGSASIMNMIILESLGWEKGWKTLTSIAANTNHFTHSSSDPIRAIVTGDAMAAMAIDFYAWAQIADVGAESLGFVLPAGETILDPDPIAILKGAPNRKVAEAFINFVMKPSEQALLMLPQGAEGGPRRSTLGRMGISKPAYEMTEGRRVVDLNPFDLESSLNMDMEKSARMQRVLNDLVGAIFIDTHSELKARWKEIIEAHGQDIPEAVLLEFSRPPLSLEELMAAVDEWDDDRVRNRKINEWVAFARSKFKQTGANQN